MKYLRFKILENPEGRTQGVYSYVLKVDHCTGRIKRFYFLGIDHFLALECFHDVQQGGGKIESFVSFCGGLPAPECSDNPLGYKFSWSPRGALLNMLSGGKS